MDAVGNRRRRRLRLISSVAAAVGQAVIAPPSMFAPRKEPERMHNSILQAEDWTQELLTGHQGRMKSSFGMSPPVFRKLVAELERLTVLGPTCRGRSSEEQVGIFLYIMRHGLAYRSAAERFQRSADTIGA